MTSPIAAPYNPLNIPNVALSLALEVLEQPAVAIPPPAPFEGPGIYLLYYCGNFPLYAPLARANSRKAGPKIPIYVGKAVRRGTRKGIDFGPSREKAIYVRLTSHRKSIQLAQNLDINHFLCRYLVVEDAFISLAESVLISVFSPLWNQVVDGFGNNPTGEPRSKQAKSEWDVLHPGRVRGLGEAKRPQKDIEKDVKQHLASRSSQVASSELRRIRQRIQKYGLA
jgi:hypothetical protein